MDIQTISPCQRNYDAFFTSNNQPSIDRSAGEMTLLPTTFFLGENDVLCGRGKNCFRHVGNQKFRKLVQDCLGHYTRVPTKAEKTLIIRAIISVVRAKSHVGGFVKHDPLTGRYYEIGDKLAREKTSQAVRDALYGENRTNCQVKAIRHLKASRNESFSSLRNQKDSEWNDIGSSQVHEYVQQCQPDIPSSIQFISHATLDFNDTIPLSIVTTNDCNNANYSEWYSISDNESRIMTEMRNNLFMDDSRLTTHGVDSNQIHLIPIHDQETNVHLDQVSEQSILYIPKPNDTFAYNELLSGETIKQIDPSSHEKSGHEVCCSSAGLMTHENLTAYNMLSTAASCMIDNEEESNISQFSPKRRNSLDWENLLNLKNTHEWWLTSQDDPFDL